MEVLNNIQYVPIELKNYIFALHIAHCFYLLRMIHCLDFFLWGQVTERYPFLYLAC